MQNFKRMLLLLLLPSLITGVSIACGLGGGDESPTTDTTEQESATEASPQSEEAADSSEAPTKSQAVEMEESIEVREAATVFAAAQVIDLRGLSLPTEIKSMGQNEVGNVSFELPSGDVASVVELYQSDFIEQGWQNDAENEYTDEATANRFFSKDDFVVSLSVSKLGDSIMVTVNNHGNIDFRALPQTTDAEPLYQFPNTLGFVSPSKVSDVADFIRQELAAQGWQEYTQPNTASADNDDSQSLSFIQNGLELSAFISVAPAQGNKTSVQYTISLLPVDLPVYDEAINLEFDKHVPYLSYKSAADIETLADFYLEEMVALGWTEMPDTATTTPEQALHFFSGQQLSANESEQYALMLEVVSVDGQSRATLRQFDADEVLTLQETQAEETTAAEADLSSVPAFLIPDEAQNIEHHAEVGIVNYTISQDMETLLNYYQQALTDDGWEESVSFTTEDYSDVQFIRGNELIFISLENSGDGDILAMIDLGSTASISDDAETTFDDEQLASGDSSTEMPALPIAADAQDVVYDADFGQITYNSSTDIETIVEFYRDALSAEGWQEDKDFSYVDETFATLDFEQGESTLTVDLLNDGFSGVTEVSMYGYGPVWEGAASTSAASSSSEELTLIEESGFLIPSDNTGYFTEGSQFSEIATVYTPSDFETLAALYERELPNYGGNLEGYTIQISENRFDITEPDGNLLVTFQVVEGETEMTMFRKDAEAAAEAGILPASGKGRIYFGNILEEGDIIVAIEGRTVTVPPSDPEADSPDGFEYVELEPGTYTVTLTLPDGSQVSDDVKLHIDSVVMLLLDTDGPWPLMVY